jgi:NADH dehydrogenase/NADH:ubiquinone oxidoreductase subunit G
MVTLTIDDKQVSVEKDATIYDAAKAVASIFLSFATTRS